MTVAPVPDQNTRAMTPDEVGLHPIVRQDKFKTLSNLEYFVIKPALHLVTRILTTKTPDFWHAFQNGELVPGSSDATPTLRRTTKTADLSTEDRRNVASLLESVANHIRGFLFPAFPTKDGSYHARKSPEGKPLAAIFLNRRLLTDILIAADDRARSSHLFHLAITILHEIAHATAHMIRGTGPEPFFEDGPIAELGEAYESLLLGGLPLVEYGGVVLRSWPGSWCRENVGCRRGELSEFDLKVVVHPLHIQQLFTQAYWENEANLKADELRLTVVSGVRRDRTDCRRMTVEEIAGFFERTKK